MLTRIMHWRSAGTSLRQRLIVALSKDRASAAGFVLLSALALFSRFWAIDHKSLWYDEVFSWELANVSLTHMFDLTAHDVHPPFYFGVLHYWVQMAGNSEASLRAPSALSGAATIVLLAIVARRVGGWLLAAATAMLLLSNAAYLTATQEARMYPLLGLLALASSVALAGFIAKPSIFRFVPYAALAIGLIYTHYSGFIAVSAQGLVFGVYGLDRAIRKRNGWILVAGLVLIAVLILAYIPWWSTFRAHPRPGGAAGYPQMSVALVTDIGGSALGLEQAGRVWLVFALPILLLGAYGVAKRWRDPRALSIAAIALVPVGQILVSLQFEPILSARQVRPYIPGLAFVCALGFVEAVALSRRLMRFAPAGYAAVVLAGVAMLVLMAIMMERTYQGPSRQDWRAAAADLGAAPAVIAPGYQYKSLEYYRGSTFRVTPLWSGIIREMGDGYVPITRDNAASETNLILQAPEGDALSAFQPYFDVEGISEYHGFITIYKLRPLTAAEYNVEVFRAHPGAIEWTETADGYLQTAAQASYFSLRSPADKDHSNGVDEDFVLHIEYLDAGPPSFSLVGSTAGGVPSPLKTVSIEGTGGWKAVDVLVKKGSDLRDVFYLTSASDSGVTIRTLEIRRYELVGVDVPRSSADPKRRWFLRTDGYLQNIAPNVCVLPAEPSAGAAGSQLVLTSYSSAEWVDAKVTPTSGSPLCFTTPSGQADLIVRRIALHAGS